MSSAREPPRRPRILIIDDHPVFRFGLGQLLQGEEDLEVCGEAVDSASALDAAQRLRPDLAITDISLPGVGGIELIKRLRALYPELRLLVVSMHDEALFAERSLRAGAGGYVMKDAPASALLGALRRVLRGEMAVSEEIANKMLQTLVRGRERDRESTLACLSDRELEVYELIGRGMRTRDIAEALHISVKTVEAHQASIKHKLGIDSTTTLRRDAAIWLAGGGQGARS
ncbi:MAG: response regulator transcription factor [Nannocystis sp.]|nr:response regulator transcription factor [Nannocystis sp.]